MIHIYKISPGYRRCTVWEGNDDGSRRGVHTTTPTSKITAQRRRVIAKWLKLWFGIKLPESMESLRARSKGIW